MKLKVGDKIYIMEYNDICGIEIITRVTRTMAKSDRYSFDDVDDNGYVRLKGMGTWSSKRGLLETPELIAKYGDKLVAQWFSKRVFTIDEMKKIYNLFK